MKAVVIAAMIASLHPKMPVSQRLEYATIISADSDPALDIAIPEHESRMVQGAIGGTHDRCFGMAQKCVETFGVCRADYQSPECERFRNGLLDGPTALRQLVADLHTWRVYCRKATGRRPTTIRILSGYAGADGHGITCGQRRVGGRWHDVKPSKVVREIMQIRSKLLGGSLQK